MSDVYKVTETGLNSACLHHSIFLENFMDKTFRGFKLLNYGKP